MASKKQQQSRLDAMKPRVKPVDLFSSLKLELSALIVIATAIAFAMCWFLLKFGWSGWIAMPLTLVVALGITYFFSRGITAPLRQMRDVAEAMADGDYTVRVDINQDRHDEVGQLARSFNEMAGELEHADKMRRDMIANVSHELRTPVSALQAMVENMADGVIEPTPANLESILTQTQRLSDLIAFLLDLSRMEAGAASLNIEKFNFADFLDETIEPLEIADGGHAHQCNDDDVFRHALTQRFAAGNGTGGGAGGADCLCHLEAPCGLLKEAPSWRIKAFPTIGIADGPA